MFGGERREVLSFSQAATLTGGRKMSREVGNVLLITNGHVPKFSKVQGLKKKKKKKKI